MSELIPISSQQIDGNAIQTVNARELHAHLEVGRDFSNWIKQRIDKYGFLENQDFVIVENLSSPNPASAKSRAQVLIDYYLTIGMAKELCMVENNAQGRKARRYFIECEKKLQEVASRSALPGTYKEAIAQLLAQLEENEGLQHRLEEDRSKVQALDRLATSDGSLAITNAAKDLQVRPKDLFALLSETKWIYRRAGGAGWIAYQDKLQQGLLEHKVTIVERSDGTEKTAEQVRVTPKGLAKLAKLIAERDAA